MQRVRSRGRQQLVNQNTICQDTEFRINKLSSAMTDRAVQWRTSFVIVWQTCSSMFVMLRLTTTIPSYWFEQQWYSAILAMSPDFIPTMPIICSFIDFILQGPSILWVEGNIEMDERVYGREKCSWTIVAKMVNNVAKTSIIRHKKNRMRHHLPFTPQDKQRYTIETQQAILTNSPNPCHVWPYYWDKTR